MTIAPIRPPHPRLDLALAVRALDTTGLTIPHAWWDHFRDADDRVDWPALVLLALTVAVWTPHEGTDYDYTRGDYWTGHYQLPFGTSWIVDPDRLGARWGLDPTETRRALDALDARGLIRLIRRDVYRKDGTWVENALCVEPVPEAIHALSDAAWGEEEA